MSSAFRLLMHCMLLVGAHSIGRSHRAATRHRPLINRPEINMVSVPLAPDHGTPPRWVTKVNAALERGAAAYVFTFVLLDLGTALALCFLSLHCVSM